MSAHPTGKLLIQMTRDSVCAADDVDAPHFQKLAVPKDTSIEDIISCVVESRYLPSITGGMATWSVASGIPVAVIAQQWDKPAMVCSTPHPPAALDLGDGVLRLHVNYHAQQDPAFVLEVLRRLRLRMVGS